MNWTHLSDTTPTARKEHRCYLCGRTIKVGEKHVRRVGRDGDGIFDTRMHELCESKTHKWAVDEWKTFAPGDEHDFRRYELGEEDDEA